MDAGLTFQRQIKKDHYAAGSPHSDTFKAKLRNREALTTDVTGIIGIRNTQDHGAITQLTGDGDKATLNNMAFKDMDTVAQDDAYNLCDSEESSDPFGCEPRGDDCQFFDKSSTDSSSSTSQSKKPFKRSKKRKLQISDFYDLEAKCRDVTSENRLDSESESMDGFIDDSEIINGRQYYSYVDNNYFPIPKKRRTTVSSNY